MVQQARDLGHSHTQDTLDTFLQPDVLTFTDQAANPDAAGEVQRNGVDLYWHNGTVAGRLFFAGGVDIPVVDGGTGVSTSTGSGSVVLATSPTLVTPLIDEGTNLKIRTEAQSGQTALQAVNDAASAFVAFRIDGLPLLLNTQSASGVVVGGPTGGSQGAGTLNAVAVYDDGVLLTDHVLDTAVEGRIAPTRYPERLRAWVAQFDPAWLDPGTYETHWRTQRRLPLMPDSPATKPSVGGLLNTLVLNVEVLAVHLATARASIVALTARVAALEGAR